MRRFLLVAVMCGAASVAQAADMPDLPFLRGSFTDGLTSAKVNWQGFYVGGQVSYGSVTSKVAGNANSDLQSTYRRPANVDYNWQPLPIAHSNTTGFGGFSTRSCPNGARDNDWLRLTGDDQRQVQSV